MSLDMVILTWMNQWSGTWFVDKTVLEIANNHLFKGGLFMVVYYALWFSLAGKRDQRKAHITATLIGSVVTVGAVRLMAMLLPMRLRPIHDLGIVFTLPQGVDRNFVDGMNAMPSDHAALFFLLAVSLFWISRPAGYAMTAYTILFVALPRLYLGYHYLSDILVGAAIGIAVALLVNNSHITSWLSTPLLVFEQRHPAWFYAFFFLLTYQIAELYNNSRGLMEALFAVVKKIVK